MGQETINWSERTTFVGFDWAGDHHDVVVVDQRGKIVKDFRIDDTAEGWQRLIKKLNMYADVAVAIETSSGATVERLLEAGYAVYPVNPKAAKRYRERKAPSGTKTDHIDGWSHLWANLTRAKCPWADAYYQKKREEGQSHACALRCLGQRWLKILWKMWQTRKRYEPELHQRNQLRHGSWVLGLMSAQNA